MRKLIFIAITVFSSPSFAEWNPADEDLENCKWRNGIPMSENQCAEFRAEVAGEKERQRMQAEYLEQSRIERAKKAADDEKRQVAIEENRQKRIAEQARLDEDSRRIREKEDRETAKQEAELKRRCGKDYMNPQIGMKLARAKLCVGDLALESQINRKDGVVSTYTNGSTYINVMNDKIVSWHRF